MIGTDGACVWHGSSVRWGRPINVKQLTFRGWRCFLNSYTEVIVTFPNCSAVQLSVVFFLCLVRVCICIYVLYFVRVRTYIDTYRYTGRYIHT